LTLIGISMLAGLCAKLG